MEITFTLNQINEIVQNSILPLLKTKKIFTFTGPLGAGKTTMIKEIFKQCGVTDVVSSPTFGYVKSYKVSGVSSKTGDITFHHFDLYRVDSLESFIHEGLDEYLHQENSYCFIEWPGVIENLLNRPGVQERVCKISMTHLPDERSKRLMKIS